MRTREADIARIQVETAELKEAFLGAINAHGERHVWIDPQVVVSALGSTVIDLFAGMSQSALPPQAVASFVSCADAYFKCLPDHIATAAAGKLVPFSSVTVTTPGPVRPVTHDGGRA